jgi:hypothetical protein
MFSNPRLGAPRLPRRASRQFHQARIKFKAKKHPMPTNSLFSREILVHARFPDQIGAPDSPSVQYQDAWRCCQRCRGLFYGGFPDQDVCAAGGKHDDANSNDYMMPFGDAGPGMQPSWRWCKKCQGIFYAGNPTSGACPSGDQHDGSTSALYNMSLEGPAGLEKSWRWCAKCEGLFSVGKDKEACPTGGQHDDGMSASYGMKLGALPKAPAPKLKPQLFLIETYLLSTFRGDLIRGPLLTTLPEMPPHAEITYKVITTKKTETDIAKSSTVLDSTSEQTQSSFNQQLQDSSDTKSSSENYDYQMQASAHAEGSLGFDSASGDASVSAAGSTNDARHEMAQSVGHAIENQVSQANQARQDQVTTASQDTKIDETTQTEYGLTRKNDSDQVLNLAIFQMKQEQVSILSLIDVQVAFRNTDQSRSRTVKLFELDSLLEGVIATVQNRILIKDRIKGILANIRDVMDESRTILIQDPAHSDSLVVNKRLTSTHELKNDDGSTRRVISVPGIILDAYTRYLFQPGTIVLPIVG